MGDDERDKSFGSEYAESPKKGMNQIQGGGDQVTTLPKLSSTINTPSNVSPTTLIISRRKKSRNFPQILISKQRCVSQRQKNSRLGKIDNY